MLKNLIAIGISILLAIFFMYLALKDLDFGIIKNSLYKANYFWVFISALFAILAYGFRAIRWNLLLEPMNYRIKNSNAFWTIAFGYMMNLTIPRSGELARASALYGVEGIPIEKSFATIVVERVVDLCFMLLFLLFTLVFNGEVLYLFFNRLINYQGNIQQKNSFTDFFMVDLLRIGDLQSILKIFLFTGVILGLCWLVLKFKLKIQSILRGILEGVLSVFKMKSKLSFLFYSVGIWFCYFLSAYFICFALEETASFSLGSVFLIITAGTFGMMVPTSGGAGSYHIAVKVAISGIFLSLGKGLEEGEKVGLTYALISHTMQLISMLLMGLIAIPVLLKRKKYF